MNKPKNEDTPQPETPIDTQPQPQAKAEKPTDQEHDMKKDLSFFSFPSSVKKEREEYGHYEQPNY